MYINYYYNILNKSIKNIISHLIENMRIHIMRHVKGLKVKYVRALYFFKLKQYSRNVRNI